LLLIKIKMFPKALTLFVLVGAVAAQYNYQKPPAPKNTYLPPVSVTEKLAEAVTPESVHEPGDPYDFTYSINENENGVIDHTHKAKSDGDVVKGEYRTLLPDGRTQIVRYTADWKNGYNAEVIYEGEAVYPEEKPTTRRPITTTKNPYLQERNVDAEAGYPKRVPQPPPRQPTNLYGTPNQSFGARNNPKFGNY
jgi:hypothetical protein